MKYLFFTLILISTVVVRGQKIIRVRHPEDAILARKYIYSGIKPRVQLGYICANKIRGDSIADSYVYLQSFLNNVDIGLLVWPDTSCKVVSYSFSVLGKNYDLIGPYRLYGNHIYGEAMTCIERCRYEDVFAFEDVKIKCPRSDTLLNGNSVFIKIKLPPKTTHP